MTVWTVLPRAGRVMSPEKVILSRLSVASIRGSYLTWIMKDVLPDESVSFRIGLLNLDPTSVSCVDITRSAHQGTVLPIMTLSTARLESQPVESSRDILFLSFSRMTCMLHQ